ncbi:glycosyltransferase family 1 protein [Opitutaceae bacterium EW11]|nr:glycosyltransferase family 1 protein [Opitutaceae bacterium EW11]
MDFTLLHARGDFPRIAMVSTHGYVGAVPPLGAADTGGQVVYVLELSKKLAQLGFEVDIWTRRFADQPEVEAVANRVRIIRMPCAGRGFIRKEDLWEFLPEWCDYAIAFIEEHGLKYEFINSHYWDGGMAGQFLSDTLGVPHLHTPHSLGLWKQRQMERDFPQDRDVFEAQYNFGRRVMEERRLYGDCSLIVATTPPQLDMLAGEYDVPSDKLRMVPPGYDDNRYFPVSEPSRQAIRKRLGFRGKVVLALGRLARNKGYDLLVKAFALTAERHPDALLYLAVGGQDMTPREFQMLDELRTIAARLGLSERVRFGASVPESELADYYRAADLFVLSSRYEPFGMTAIEAMASGTPTVVTVHGGLYRALSFGRHALFADPFDREDLGITMAKVFRHPRLRQRLSRMGAHKARSLFTWTGVAQQVLSFARNETGPSVLVDDTEWDEPWNDGD